MHRIEQQVFLNGRFIRRSEATLDIEDRGFMFSDGVYEVVRYYAGHPLAIDRHHHRMRQGLDAIEIESPTEFDRFCQLSDELVQRNGLSDAKVYWQVTRGAAPREHDSRAPLTPTALMIAYPAAPLDPTTPVPTASVILTPDIRWQRCCVKTIMLLPNVLAKRRARSAGAVEAIFHRDGLVTEGAATNVLIVRRGALWTHPADSWILNGITRQLVIESAKQQGIAVQEQAFTTQQLQDADEALLCGTTTHVTAITKLDGQTLGQGEAGPVTTRLHRALMRRIDHDCLNKSQPTSKR